MTLFIAVFIVIQLALLVGLARLIARRGLNGMGVFGIVYAGLIVIPFTLIALHENGDIALDRYVGRAIGNNLVLEIGSGRLPLLNVALFEIVLTASYLVASQRAGRRRRYPWRPATKRYLEIAAISNIGLVGYVLVRTIFVPDFPLFALLKGQPGRLRDTAFSFATNSGVPYPFLPQIYGVVHQVLLPTAGLMLLSSSAVSGNRRTRRWAIASLVFSALLNIGTFKRAQFLFFGSMIFVYFVAKQRPRFRSLIYGLVGAAFVIFMTAAYSGFTDFGKASQDALNRTLVTEAIVEYTAINHYGETFDHLGLELPMTHLAKVAGSDVQTFSEQWKQQSAGSDSRGFASVGIVGESWVAAGWFGVTVVSAALGIGLASVDRSLSQRSSPFRRPYEATLIMVVAFMGSKGVLSQLFSGGLLGLLVFWFVVRAFAASGKKGPRYHSRRPGGVRDPAHARN